MSEEGEGQKFFSLPINEKLSKLRDRSHTKLTRHSASYPYRYYCFPYTCRLTPPNRAERGDSDLVMF